MRDPYQILGLTKTASQEDIRKAYRSQAKKFHPDLNPGNKEAETKFKELATAYELIGTQEARKKFDRGEAAEQQQAREHSNPFYYNTQQDGGRYSYSFGQDMGIDDIFENLFTSARKPSRKPQRESQTESETYKMEIDFKESVLGAEREITLPNGQKIRIKIPAGVQTGTKLRLGNIFLEISVRELPGFKRMGDNIEVEVPISFMEALVGAEIRVPTVDGPILLKIPANVSTGSRLRIRGKGVQKENRRGDQIIYLKVVMPKKADPQLQAAIRDLGEKYSYNPRAGANE